MQGRKSSVKKGTTLNFYLKERTKEENRNIIKHTNCVVKQGGHSGIASGCRARNTQTGMSLNTQVTCGDWDREAGVLVFTGLIATSAISKLGKADGLGCKVKIMVQKLPPLH